MATLRLVEREGTEGGTAKADPGPLPSRYVPPEGGVVELGQGGVGRVLLLRDELLGREVAWKEVLPGRLGVADARLEDRLLQEARLTARLEHPCVVPIYDAGRRPDGRPYFTMKVVRGHTLTDAIVACPGLVERLLLLRHVVDLAEALGHAHDRGIVHRDVKPDNVMVGEFGETVVLDWGLAKVLGAEESVLERAAIIGLSLEPERQRRTVAGRAIGTPAYLSPEQAEGRGEAVDERSDVWGLGAVLYEVLTGWPPFHADTPARALERVLRRSVEPVRFLEPNAPAGLAAVAEKALRRERADRYPSARAFARAVEAFLPVPRKAVTALPERQASRPREPAAALGRFSLPGELPERQTPGAA